MKDYQKIIAALQRYQADQASQDDLELLAAFGQQISRDIQGVKSQESVYLNHQIANQLLSTVASLSSHLELETVMQNAAEQMARILEVEVCTIWKWDSRAQVLTLWVQHPRPEAEVDFPKKRHSDLEAIPLVQKALTQGIVTQGRIDDPTLGSDERHYMQLVGSTVLLLVPLIAMEDTAGLIVLSDAGRTHSFTRSEIEMSKLLTSCASMALERVNLLQAADQRTAQLEALHQASLSLTASLDLPEVLDSILQSTMDLIPGSQDAHIFLYEGGRLSFGSALWADGQKGTPFAEPRQEGLTYTVAREGRATVVQDVSIHHLYADVPAEWAEFNGSIVGLPLKIGERVVGVMNVANEQPNAFSESTLRLLRLLADQAAIAIENARLHKLVIEQARTDIITGLSNRRALDNRLQEEVQRSSRYGRPFSLIMMDLDDFKRVNDTYGHPVGDQVLRQIAECISEVVRDTDFLARFGGDEFTLVLTETDLQAGQKLARRVQQAVARCRLKLPDARLMTLTVSMGMATYPVHADTATTLLVVADQALYQAKAKGPGQFVRAPEPAEGGSS